MNTPATRLVLMAALLAASACQSSVTVARLLPSHSPHGEAVSLGLLQGAPVRGELITVTPTGAILLGDSLRFVPWVSMRNIHLLSACRMVSIGAATPSDSIVAVLATYSRVPPDSSADAALARWRQLGTHRAVPPPTCHPMHSRVNGKPHYDPPSPP